MMIKAKNGLKFAVKVLSSIFNIFPINKKKFYLMCFDGDKWGFDQKALYEYVETTYPGEYSFVWEYKHYPPKSPDMPASIKQVKEQTVRQLFHSKTSKYIVCGINPKGYIAYRKKQIIANTWHGYPLKGMQGEYDEYIRSLFALADVFCSYSGHFTDFFIRGSCGYKGEILPCGAPRNDIFFDESSVRTNAQVVRSTLGLFHDVKVALYAPTFRGNSQKPQGANVQLDYDTLLNSLQDRFQGRWVLLLRQHPRVPKEKRTAFRQEAVIDVSEWEDTQVLMCAVDVLITDYSSTPWDFSQMGRPVFRFVPDIELYQDRRGLSFGLDELPWPYAKTNAELANIISSFDESSYREQLTSFFAREKSYEQGRACEQLFNELIRFGVD